MIVRFLQPSDDRSLFSCGDPAYDDFLRKYAAQNQFKHRIGKTLVAVEDERVVGHATFSLGEVANQSLPEGDASRLPRYPCPVLRLARLAVDVGFQGQGLGTYLVAEVLALALRVRDEYGCVAVVVDALKARLGFYEGLGFEPTPVLRGRPRVKGTVPMVLMLSQIEAAMGPVE